MAGTRVSLFCRTICPDETLSSGTAACPLHPAVLLAGWVPGPWALPRPSLTAELTPEGRSRPLPWRRAGPEHHGPKAGACPVFFMLGVPAGGQGHRSLSGPARRHHDGRGGDNVHGPREERTL